MEVGVLRRSVQLTSLTTLRIFKALTIPVYFLTAHWWTRPYDREQRSQRSSPQPEGRERNTSHCRTRKNPSLSPKCYKDEMASNIVLLSLCQDARGPLSLPVLTKLTWSSRARVEPPWFFCHQCPVAPLQPGFVSQFHLQCDTVTL